MSRSEIFIVDQSHQFFTKLDLNCNYILILHLFGAECSSKYSSDTQDHHRSSMTDNNVFLKIVDVFFV